MFRNINEKKDFIPHGEKAFRANEYITLGLQMTRKGGVFIKETALYVGRNFFTNCMNLILQLPEENVKHLDEIDSIDEVVDVHDHFLKRNEIGKNPPEEMYKEVDYKRFHRENKMRFQAYKISPEEEFWGHCSNIQAWCENEYDTRLLHSNLAFPLLKELSEAGDPKARKVFKEEITKRVATNYKPVIKFLFEERFLSYLNREELLELRVDAEELDLIRELEKELGETLEVHYEEEFYDYHEYVYSIECKPHFFIENNHVVAINFRELNMETVPQSVIKFTELKELNLYINKIKEIPQFLQDAKKLENLVVSENEIKLVPHWIVKMPSLKYIEIDGVITYEAPLKMERYKIGKIAINYTG